MGVIIILRRVGIINFDVKQSNLMVSVFSYKQVIEGAYLQAEIDPKMSGKVVDFLGGGADPLFTQRFLKC